MNLKIKSKKSVFDNKKPIRGGIPIVFPNFGTWDNNRPRHGFARTKRWRIKEPVNKVLSQTNLLNCRLNQMISDIKSQTDESVSVSLSLVDDDETRQLWNFNFELVYFIKITRNSLETKLTVHNTGNQINF